MIKNIKNFILSITCLMVFLGGCAEDNQKLEDVVSNVSELSRYIRFVRENPFPEQWDQLQLKEGEATLFGEMDILFGLEAYGPTLAKSFRWTAQICIVSVGEDKNCVGNPLGSSNAGGVVYLLPSTDNANIVDYIIYTHTSPSITVIASVKAGELNILYDSFEKPIISCEDGPANEAMYLKTIYSVTASANGTYILENGNNRRSEESESIVEFSKESDGCYRLKQTS